MKYLNRLQCVVGIAIILLATQSAMAEPSKPSQNSEKPVVKFHPGQKAGDQWVNSHGMVFCWCPPGSYLAGSPADEPGRYEDESQREVVIREGFWIGKYEVTKGQWTGSAIRNCLASDDQHPQDMAMQSKDANRALKSLNESEAKAGALPPDWEYALPTEDQWEYAARAGTTSRFYFGDDIKQLPQHANFGDRSYYDTLDIYSNSAHRTLDDGFAKLAPIGSLKPNPWGLHDVYGNLAEWCENAVTRGGSWVSSAENCRSAYRHKFGDRDKEPFIGFRFVIRRK
ncbi:SUMF1/EgtB/PvdO family nonheme iron enzyme [bacterium]|nr:SUMF1/EgtB/PvdO family nonheme iron enzyme [bacterium]